MRKQTDYSKPARTAPGSPRSALPLMTQGGGDKSAMCHGSGSRGGGAAWGFGFGRRSVESGMILETADALNLAVLNTWFVQSVGRAWGVRGDAGVGGRGRGLCGRGVGGWRGMWQGRGGLGAGLRQVRLGEPSLGQGVMREGGFVGTWRGRVGGAICSGWLGGWLGEMGMLWGRAVWGAVVGRL